MNPKDASFSNQQSKEILKTPCSAKILILKVKFQVHCMYSYTEKVLNKLLLSIYLSHSKVPEECRLTINNSNKEEFNF